MLTGVAGRDVLWQHSDQTGLCLRPPLERERSARVLAIAAIGIAVASTFRPEVDRNEVRPVVHCAPLPALRLRGNLLAVCALRRGVDPCRARADPRKRAPSRLSDDGVDSKEQKKQAPAVRHHQNTLGCLPRRSLRIQPRVWGP